MPNQSERATVGAAKAIAAGIDGEDGASPVIDLSVYQRHIDHQDGVS